MALDTALEGKPLWWGLAIGVGIVVVAVALVHFFLVDSADGINKRIATLRTELDKLEEKIQAGKAAERKLPQFREQVAELERELEKLRRILPSSRNTEEIIKKLKALVDQGNFELRRLRFPALGAAPKDEVPIVDWPIQVEVSGTYHDLAILFNRLSNFARIINVEEFTITAVATQDARTIDANFVAKTFVYIEQEPGPDPQGTPGQRR
jgi:type IV pilus assembly protein PilO